jgi:hypothetical protein
VPLVIRMLLSVLADLSLNYTGICGFILLSLLKKQSRLIRSRFYPCVCVCVSPLLTFERLNQYV